MSCFTQYKLKDGRRIRGRYDSKSTKVCISRSDLEGLIYEADVAYEQAKQLQTIIENLLEIKQRAITEVLDKIRAEIEKLRMHKAQFLTSDCKVCIDSQEVLDIIDKYKSESRDDK